jgi:hypothetical protein
LQLKWTARFGDLCLNPEPTSWFQKEWKSWRTVLGLIVVLFILSNLKGAYSRITSPPVSLEADGKQYVACNTPDISRGFFHLASTYSVDFRDHKGSTISLPGVEKLTVTNLPQQVDAPMPSLMPITCPILILTVSQRLNFFW